MARPTATPPPAGQSHTVNSPRISAAICTRDRGAAIQRPLQAIFDGTWQDFEVVVIDQSEDDTTESAIAEWRGDPRLIYVRTQSRGLSRARNEALALFCGPLLAWTDDDCEPAPDWLERYIEAGATESDSAIFFGPFLARYQEGDVGMIPAWAPRRARRVTTRYRQSAMGGCGGNMMMNRMAVESVGRFSDNLGRGTPFSAAEESDYAYRVTRAGGVIRELDGPKVDHFGLVPSSRIRGTARRDSRSMGAMLAWHLRKGDIAALSQLAIVVWKHIRIVAMAVKNRRRPLGIARVGWVLAGFASGMVRGPRSS